MHQDLSPLPSLGLTLEEAKWRALLGTEAWRERMQMAATNIAPAPRAHPWWMSWSARKGFRLARKMGDGSSRNGGIPPRLRRGLRGIKLEDGPQDPARTWPGSFAAPTAEWGSSQHHWGRRAGLMFGPREDT